MVLARVVPINAYSLHELVNFEDEISLRRGDCNTRLKIQRENRVLQVVRTWPSFGPRARDKVRVVAARGWFLQGFRLAMNTSHPRHCGCHAREGVLPRVSSMAIKSSRPR